MPAQAMTRDERALLAILATGTTDEAAASRLGLSSRTVRRRRRPGRDSRGAPAPVQAGARAGRGGARARGEPAGGASAGSSLSLWIRNTV